MNEKTLVKGEFSTLNLFAIVFLVLAAVVLVACFLTAIIATGDPSWAFEGIRYGYPYYLFFIGSGLFLILGLVLSFIRFELTVTDGRVIGTTWFGIFRKRVDLPISQISAIGTGTFKRVSVATSSGKIVMYGVINQEEVYSVVSQLLLKRQ